MNNAYDITRDQAISNSDYKNEIIVRLRNEKKELLEFVNKVVNNEDVNGNYNEAVYLNKKYRGL